MDEERVAAGNAMQDGDGDVVAEVKHFKHFGHDADGRKVEFGGVVVVAPLKEDDNVAVGCDFTQEAARFGTTGGDGNQDSGEEYLVHQGEDGHLVFDAVVVEEHFFVVGVDHGHYIGADVHSFGNHLAKFIEGFLHRVTLTTERI